MISLAMSVSQCILQWRGPYHCPSTLEPEKGLFDKRRHQNISKPQPQSRGSPSRPKDSWETWPIYTTKSLKPESTSPTISTVHHPNVSDIGATMTSELSTSRTQTVTNIDSVPKGLRRESI
ncbi:hypothetical protein DOTSEDRAFT_70798 [Dothistroma septosporum NZE10]|uniref:Uncharacterized protein n=1 Tax=Dothistroma septosporum (strain NZE10 / CBS 128990) TaxID=675120 RepID=N1PPJ3_DOTSN|nr:hypothetical protein DOTSEDRAFT_70798 [Dothistroma septosporum NZE10]